CHDATIQLRIAQSTRSLDHATIRLHVKEDRTVLIPTVIETTNRGERAYDIYSRLLRERIVFLGTALDESVANLIIAQLLHLEGEDMDRPVNLYINSPGGDMTALFAVYDAMQFMGPPVHTVCV